MNEILSPAGNMDMLKYAIKAGCDAVYISGKNYGARKFANNFTNEELKEAILYAHIRGVKVYITVNTIIFESELVDAVNYVKYLYEMGADAIIIQDIGLIEILSEKYPEIKLHASTQLHNYNNYQLELLKKFNIKRVVVPREMSLDEVSKLDKNIEKEVFIHGALCSSYSGQCLFSHHVLKRSGNRGECAGMCRLPFQNDHEEKYFLSMNDLCSIDFFDKIKKKGFSSLKIEGRMKSKEYVYFVTKIYKDLLNNVYDKEDLKKLNIIFNRGYTKGYLGEDKSLFNLKSSNHIGIPFGKVIDIDDTYIKLILLEDFYQEDSIRINNDGKVINFLYDNRKLLTNFVGKGETCYIKNNIDCKVGDEVRKTKSYFLEKELLKIPEKKSPVNLEISLKLGERVRANLKCLGKNVTVYGEKIESAKNYPVTKDNVIKIFNKIKETPFYFENMHILMDDNIYINIKDLNELKRDCIAQLLGSFISTKKLNDFSCEEKKNKKQVDMAYEVFVPNENMFLDVKKYKINKFITNDFDLYNKYKAEYPMYYKVERLNIDKDYVNENLLITDLSMVERYKNNKLINDYFLNVSNSSYVSFLTRNNILNPLLSIETPLSDIKEMLRNFDLTVLVYSKIEVMLIKRSVFKKGDTLFDRKDEEYDIKLDDLGHTHIVSNHLFQINGDDFENLIDNGLKNVRINLSVDDEDNIKEIFEKYKVGV